MSKEICVNYDESDVTCESCILNKVQNHNSCFKPVKKEQKTVMQTTTNYDDAQVNHPSHYQQDGRLECLDELLLMFGKDDVITWCRLTAYKYYYRCGNKSGESAEKDRAKAMFYLNYVKKLQEMNGNEN